jgi:hypothetical protein
MPMNDETITRTLPVGGVVLHPEQPQPSIELAEDLARRGASKWLVQAVGGEAAVRRIFGSECADSPKSDTPVARPGI